MFRRRSNVYATQKRRKIDVEISLNTTLIQRQQIDVDLNFQIQRHFNMTSEDSVAREVTGDESGSVGVIDSLQKTAEF